MSDAKFDLTEPRPVHFEGSTTSAPLQIARVSEFGVIGTLFRGEIRQLRFDASGSLLVLAGRGVRRLDPRTLAETGRWLADREILEVHPCGDRLWVVTAEAIFLAAFGGELGVPFAAIALQRRDQASAAGTRLAIPLPRGVALLDAVTGTTREFLIDEAWYAKLWSPGRPDRAMLSPSGRRVGVTVQNGHYVVVWDSETGASVFARDHTEASALVDDARSFHVARGFRKVRDLASGEETSGPPSDEHFEDAQVRGDRLLLADAWGGFSLHEVATLARITGLDALPKHHGAVSSRVCAALCDTHVATCAVTAGVLRVSEIGGGTVESFDWIGGAEGLSVGQGGRRVGVFRKWEDGRLDCVDLDAARLIELRGHHEDITDSAITGDGRKVVVPCGSILRARTVHIGEFAGTESTASHPIKSCVRELVTHGDDAYAVSTYALRGSGYVGLHQAGVARAIAKITRGKESPWRICVGHGGEELMVAWESAVVLYDLRKRAKPSETWDLRSGAVALGPRGFLAFQSGDELHLRTPAAAKFTVTLAQRSGHAGARLAFSEDGALVFIGGSDGVLEVRRSHDGELLRELPLHFDHYVALQCCGAAIWTLGEDGLVHVLGLAPGGPASPAHQAAPRHQVTAG